ncbi:hypothetical protein WPS_23780 [Vulcanimicrobium alpinum]|uniref:BON domain-containing protein n=1 Tax=Vulcanimicrobium alpinum TaxID=3016050 RepID=A0AAN1XZJ3_UNVUL|nr:BON domain-containing protein [Vulcanimicrobium alpinum]BDE07102.1 hypothetical protein WPS_23780 [Vulcanimicrobium alpinum]
MRRALAFAAGLLVAGCGGDQQTKAPEPFGTRAATDVLRDGVTLAAVKAKLTAEDPDSATTLGVVARDGVVTLRGSVRSMDAKKRVVRSARGVAGVRVVVDQVRVDPNGPRPKRQLGDAALATRIVAAYTAELGFQKVSVRVDGGTATLEGTVADAKTRDAVVAAARGTSGIRNVVDRIRVEQP